MKKVFLFAALAVFGLSSINAGEGDEDNDAFTGGFSQGDYFVSGEIGYWSEKTGDNKNNIFHASPSVGYFLNDNIALSVGINYESDKDENGSFEDTMTTFGGRLSASYFFNPEKRFNPYIKGGVGFESTKYEQTGSDESKATGFRVRVAPGVNYHLSNCFSVYANLGGITYSTLNPDGDGDSTNEFHFDLGMKRLRFGARYQF
ncbi:outer membrane beta-barrel protein [Ichthyenterobacterium magnum]|uniref:Outer membrane protein with beta-barrel domain n=1 Tax=Ichthyenterobacterium magnum TaxID=1230530 RepID=A0A420DKF0_9FLAO|nr:outer membrane beta-barrel protein [Ichthyenterobacterium magnum]RKE94730.1 outer membrane protein with beta-barrel domain [Ichthyenterobacterium magnum]